MTVEIAVPGLAIQMVREIATTITPSKEMGVFVAGGDISEIIEINYVLDRERLDVEIERLEFESEGDFQYWIVELYNQGWKLLFDTANNKRARNSAAAAIGLHFDD